MANISKDFGGRLKSAIKAKGCTQLDFSSEMCMPNSTLSSYIRGRVPDGILLKKFADALDVSMDWLVTGESPEKQNDLSVVPPNGVNKEDVVFFERLRSILNNDSEENKQCIKRLLDVLSQPNNNVRLNHMGLVVGEGTIEICRSCKLLRGSRKSDCKCVVKIKS